jgi:hypothetical protein
MVVSRQSRLGGINDARLQPSYNTTPLQDLYIMAVEPRGAASRGRCSGAGGCRRKEIIPGTSNGQNTVPSQRSIAGQRKLCKLCAKPQHSLQVISPVKEKRIAGHPLRAAVFTAHDQWSRAIRQSCEPAGSPAYAWVCPCTRGEPSLRL